MTAPMISLAPQPPGPRTDARARAARAGFADAIPAILGLAPLGLALGAAIAKSHVSPLTGWATGPFIYGASAQFAALDMLGRGAAAIAVVSTVAVINARSLFYSASLRDTLRNQPRWFRWTGPYLLVDPLFALVSERAGAYREDPGGLRGYYLGAGGGIWATWLVFIAAGIALGASVPGGPGQRYAASALLIGFLVPAVRSRSSLCAVVVSVALAASVDGSLGLLVAGGGGALAGALLDRRTPSR